MTKFQKQMLTIAAAGALSAVTALPAMALENEFKGSFNVRWVMSNWEGYENQTSATTWNPATSTNLYTALTSGRAGFGGGINRWYTPAINPKMTNLFEQRAVLMYAAKASDKLALRTAFEIDTRWGDTSYGIARNAGAAIGADQVNLETKSVYLDYTCPLTDAKVKIGLQPFADQYKGVFLGPVDMAGINIAKKMGDATVTAAFYRLNDSISRATSTSASTLGRYTRDIAMLDMSYAASKDFTMGMSYYYYKDNTNGGALYNWQTFPTASIAAPTVALGTAAAVGGQAAGGIATGYNTALHTIGLRTDAKFGKVAFDAGFLAQMGNITDGPMLVTGNTVTTMGFAAQAGMKYTTDGGQFKTAFLWTSGDNTPAAGLKDTKRTAFINVQSGTRESVYTGLSSMILLTSVGRFAASDRAVTPDMYNFGQGVTAAAVGYDAKMGKGYLNTNAIFLGSTANNNNDPRHINKLTGKRNNSRYIGTELNIEPGYKLYDNLTIYTQFAYAFLGGYFKNSAGQGASTIFSNGRLSPSSLATNAKTPVDPYSFKVGLVYSF